MMGYAFSALMYDCGPLWLVTMTGRPIAIAYGGGHASDQAEGGAHSV